MAAEMQTADITPTTVRAAPLVGPAGVGEDVGVTGVGLEVGVGVGVGEVPEGGSTAGELFPSSHVQGTVI